MIEWVLIIGLGWFSYESHERAVTAEVKLESKIDEVTELRKVVKVWEDKSDELAESNRQYEDSIRDIARENSEFRLELEKLSDDESRSYLSAPIPVYVRDILTESSD